MSLKPNFLISDEKSEDTFVWQHCLITTKNWSQIVFKAPGTCRNRTHKLSIVILKLLSIDLDTPHALKWSSLLEKNIFEIPDQFYSYVQSPVVTY